MCAFACKKNWPSNCTVLEQGYDVNIYINMFIQMYSAISNLLCKASVIMNSFETAQKHLNTRRENNVFFPWMFWGRSVEQNWTKGWVWREGRSTRQRGLEGQRGCGLVMLSGHPCVAWKGPSLLERTVTAEKDNHCWKWPSLLERAITAGDDHRCWRWPSLLERTITAGKDHHCWKWPSLYWEAGGIFHSTGQTRTCTVLPPDRSK